MKFTVKIGDKEFKGIEKPNVQFETLDQHTQKVTSLYSGGAGSVRKLIYQVTGFIDYSIVKEDQDSGANPK